MREAIRAAAEAMTAYLGWADATICTEPELREIREKCRAALSLLRAASEEGGEPKPVTWGIFDSQGYYEERHREDDARSFCERYNNRKGADPAKPYTYRPLYASPVATKPDEFPQVRNRGLLQAAKQAMSALKRHSLLPWGQPGFPFPVPGVDLIWEAQNYLAPAIKWEEDFRAAMSPIQGEKEKPEQPNVHLASGDRTARNGSKDADGVEGRPVPELTPEERALHEGTSRGGFTVEDAVRIAGVADDCRTARK
jgi:hypothetical protein